jgi:hypothetical protein
MDTDELKIGKYFRGVVTPAGEMCDMLAKNTTRLEH